MKIKLHKPIYGETIEYNKLRTGQYAVMPSGDIVHCIYATENDDSNCNPDGATYVKIASLENGTTWTKNANNTLVNKVSTLLPGTKLVIVI